MVKMSKKLKEKIQILIRKYEYKKFQEVVDESMVILKKNDNDFLWKADPRKIRKTINIHPLAVVKHKDYEAQSNKMNGVENKSYPKKNWSSLMVFRCNQFKNKLTKEYLDNATPAQLHEFHFLNEENIGSIPKEYNCLVGHYDCENAKALHYTNGGPWFDEYKHSEHANEWWEVYNSL